MNVWKRGFLGVWRKPIKSFLLIALVYCIACLVAIGISASHTSARAQLEARNQVGASFILSLNMEDFYQRMEGLIEEGHDLVVIPEPPASPMEIISPPNFESLTLFLEDIERLSQVDGIEAYNIEAMMNPRMNAINFKRIEAEFQNDSELIPEITLRGVRDLSLMSIVKDGSISLMEGRWIQADDESKLVISEEMANLNQLQLGDSLILETVTMKDKLMLTVRERLGIKEPDPVQIEGEIVGIFRNNRSISFNPGVISQRSENHIFSDLNLPKVGIHEDDPFYEMATFHVTDVNQMEDIQARLQAVDINWDRYELWENQELIEQLTPAFTQLQKTGTILLVVVLISGFSILAVSFVFLVKGRSHEIGIWLALGKTKGSIAFQMIWENLLIAMMALVICIMTLPIISMRAESYFNNQMMSQTSHEENAHLYVSDVEDEKERISLTFTTNTIILTIGMSSVLIVSATSLAIIPILCLKPRDIFTRLS